MRNGQRVIELMRYGAYPPAHIQDPKRYTTYNARRDNLTSRFWSDAFQLHHGFIVLTGFFEWVLVEELLKAGAVHLQDVVSEFDRLSHGRRDQLQNQGKKWRPTPSELMEPAKRRIVIQFHPEDQEDLVVPVIFSKSKLSDGQVVAGFAIVTDTPPPEVLQAGHDRCPVVLRPGIESAWINVDYKAVKEFDALLTERRPLKFQHRLARAVEVS
ncbi:MAG: SOS response-associated peptidase family protein [Proteobacteria bacterium]|nr:SOS response-associated peptidase family protein [Pseudomonadota bacterium]